MYFRRIPYSLIIPSPVTLCLLFYISVCRRSGHLLYIFKERLQKFKENHQNYKLTKPQIILKETIVETMLLFSKLLFN